MSSRDIDPKISYEIHEALSEIFHDSDNPALLNRWILMSESIFEGGTSVAYITSPGLSTWEVLGMVEATKIVARANMETMYAEDDDEEEG